LGWEVVVGGVAGAAGVAGVAAGVVVVLAFVFLDEAGGSFKTCPGFRFFVVRLFSFSSDVTEQ
jgi:hypothetical protein